MPEQKRFSNKETRVEEMTDYLEALNALLTCSVEEIEAFGQAWNNGFHNYSFRNMVLIWYQNPKATLVASRTVWKKHGRYPAKGSKLLSILRPNTFNKWIEEENEKTGNIEKKKIQIWNRAMPYVDCYVLAYEDSAGKELDWSKFGAGKYITGKEIHVDFAAVCKDMGYTYESTTWKGPNGSINPDKHIKIANRNHPNAELACLAHELGHGELNHIDRTKNNLPRHIKEIQAEAVSYLVSCCLGIKNEKSRLYIMNWKGSKQEVTEYGPIVINTASKILGVIEKHIAQ